MNKNASFCCVLIFITSFRLLAVSKADSIYEGRKYYLGDGNPKYSRYFDDDILNTSDQFLWKSDLLAPSCKK